MEMMVFLLILIALDLLSYWRAVDSRPEFRDALSYW